MTQTTRPLAVFDLDGVLADVGHRLHHLHARPKDWVSFFAAAPEDPPLPDGVALAAELAERCEVVYLTGRPEQCRADTERWLARHQLPAGTVYMRPAGDYQPARQLKPPLLAALAAGRSVEVVVDDDPAVCAELAAAGWPVRQADWMPVEPVLFEIQEQEGRT